MRDRSMETPPRTARQMAFERSAGAIGDDGHAFGRAAANDLGTILRGFGENDRIRNSRRVMGFTATMLLAQRLRGGDSDPRSGREASP